MLGEIISEWWATSNRNGGRDHSGMVGDIERNQQLLCDSLESTREEPAITAFERLFRDRGLPLAIRSDNGVPFASPNALFNLSKLSVWWLRLGIAIERIKPGHPQQNGRHERMHLTLKT
jgi:transposase InsO family protein